MNNIFLAILIVTGISGCATGSNVAHKYTPTPTPDLAGYWVGTATMQTHTMLIRPDGTGEVCWESMGNYKTTPVTISGDKIIKQIEGTLKRNPDGTFSECFWGVCMDFKRTEHIAAACREWLKQ